MRGEYLPRATYGAKEIPGEDWQKLWAAEHAFVTAARKEIGLSGAWRTTATNDDLFLGKEPEAAVRATRADQNSE